MLRLGPEREETNSPTQHTHPLTGAETEDHPDSDQKALGVMGLVQRDTALLLRDLRLGASSWLNSFLELGGLEEIKKSQYIMNNAINEIKNTLEGTNSRITEAEDRISDIPLLIP